MAPSPQNVSATRGSRRRLNASAAPTIDRAEVAEHRDEREHAVLGRAEVHVAVTALRGGVALAEEVAECLGGRHAAREVAGELAVERRAHVVGAERVAGRCAHGLLAATGVDRAGDAALAVEQRRRAPRSGGAGARRRKSASRSVARDLGRVLAGDRHAGAAAQYAPSLLSSSTTRSTEGM